MASDAAEADRNGANADERARHPPALRREPRHLPGHEIALDECPEASVLLPVEAVGNLPEARHRVREVRRVGHSVAYHRLPDWLLGFDVYDRSLEKFWDSARRNALLERIRLHAVPRIAAGHFTIRELEKLLSPPSRVGIGVVEGLVIRRETAGFTTARAKLVRREFTQAIDEHWSHGPLRRNLLASEAAPHR